MEYLGKIKSRDIYYIHLDDIENLNINDLPNQNWLAFVFSNEDRPEIIKKVAEICVLRNFLYLCSTGKAYELIHAIFDEVIVDNLYNLKNSKIDKDILTVGGSDFNKEFWFSIWVAHHPYKDINSIVCIDMGLHKKEEIRDLMNQINLGWVPNE